LSVLLIGNLFANQVLAENVSPQPLTRLDCAKADMAWDDNANVCGATPSLAAEAVPEPQPINTAAQPLTRAGCDKAGMAWDDNANVCGAPSLAAEPVLEPQSAQPMDTVAQPLTREDCDKAGIAWDDNANVCGAPSLAAEAMPEIQELVSQNALEETTAITSTVLISIDKASQTMTVSLDGVQQYEWPVSTGLRGYTTPSGTYTARSMNKIWYSRQWDNAPMPHAVFFTKDGHAIHGTLEVKRLGKPASHGCVRLSPRMRPHSSRWSRRPAWRTLRWYLPAALLVVKEKWQIKPGQNPIVLARGTKITMRTPFLSDEDEAGFLGVCLVDKAALIGQRCLWALGMSGASFSHQS
jgi:hypothetical protein